MFPLTRDSDDLDLQGVESFNTADQPVTALHRTNAFWRAGKDQVARKQAILPGQLADDFMDVPDHLLQDRVLSYVTVYRQAQCARTEMADLRHGMDGTAWRRMVE
ncbi:hypothetical protein D3C78_1699130 [compost metagenome]